MNVSIFTQQGKICTKCGVEKSFNEFGNDAHKKDGYASQCKACRSQSQKGHSRNKNTLGERYSVSTDQHYIYNKRWEQKNQEKYVSHTAVNFAVRSGRLPAVKTQNCCNCGKQATHYHHHNGYAPEHILDVVPVCANCHKSLEHRGGVQ